MSRELLQIVELDVNYCNLTYGTSPCTAVLGTDGVRKCYNTFKTCQDTEHFGAPQEPSGGPDRSYDQGDTLTAGDFTRNADFFFAVDLTIPSAPTGCVWELGGAATGAYLGFTSGNIVFRCGDGASGTPTNAAKIDVSPSDITGKSGTLYGQIDVSANTVQLWWRSQGVNEIVLIGDDTAVGSFTDWAGSASGGCGTVSGAAPVDEDATDFNGTIAKLRVFDSTDFEPAAPDNIKVLRFARSQSGIPRSERVYPCLQSVSTNPVEINLGGANERIGAFGKRARVRVRLQDFADSDAWFDKYQAGRKDGTAQTDEGGYNPLERGTFFSKFRRRFPYYTGRTLRVREGYVGDSLASMRTRHYVVEEWHGPDAAGRVEIVAKDILSLADNKKAKCPKPSTGKIGAAIEETGLPSFDLIPETVGDEYPASGTAAIGSEIVTFTRSGDTVTLTGRAQGGSEASSHSQDDTFQLCYTTTSTPIEDVAYELLTDFAGVDTSFITQSDWQDEGSRWLAGFNLTTIISKPTGVTDLMAELSQFGALWWWDDVNQKIRMRANRPLDFDETAPSVSDATSFIEDSIDRDDLYDQRISRVLFYHGVIDYTQSVTGAGENYRRGEVPVDSSAEGPTEYNQEATYEVFSRWLGNAGDDGIASAVTARLLNRYRDTPEQITFDYDVKDNASVDVASPVTITSRIFQDETGNPQPVEMQVTSVEEVVPGHRLRAKAQSYQFSGRYGFITENSRPDYASSTDAQKAKGTYIVDETTLVFGDGAGPYLIF